MPVSSFYPFPIVVHVIETPAMYKVFQGRKRFGYREYTRWRYTIEY